MPKTTPDIKVDAVRGFGGNVVLHGSNFDEAKAEAERLSELSTGIPLSLLSIIHW